MNQKFQSVLLIGLATLIGCAAESTNTVAPSSGSTNAEGHAVSREVYELVNCSHCELDFTRVDLPEYYVLPTSDLGTCFSYVLSRNPESRDLLISGWMDCVDAVVEE